MLRRQDKILIVAAVVLAVISWSAVIYIAIDH
jgi:hypothetical protein